MKKPALLVTSCSGILLYLLFTLISCGNGVRVKSTNFDGEIQPKQNLNFAFSADLVPDSIIGKWDTTQYIHFKPEVKGNFKWISRNELVFSPYRSFRPSTDYRAELQNVLVEKYISGLQLSDDKTIQFHTQYLNYQSVNSYWSRNPAQADAIELKTEIEFSEIISPQQLLPLLQVKVAGQNKRFEIRTTESSETVLIAIQDIDLKNAELPVELNIQPGLMCQGSDYRTKAPMNITFNAPSRQNIEVLSMVTGMDQNEQAVLIYTNQEIINTDLNALISIMPAMQQYTVKKADRGLIITGDFQIGRTYEITVKGILQGVVGAPMKKDFTQAIQFGERSPEISFTSTEGIYLTSKGELNIGVQISSVPKVKVVVTKIYENNIQHFIRAGYGWTDDETGKEYFYYDGINARDYGDPVLEQEIETRSLPKRKGQSLLNLNFNDKTLFKGLYLVNIMSENESYVNATKLIAVSDIGLIAKTTEKDIHVFAHSILDASPLGGITVSLWSSNNQMVYKQSTDASGIARFTDLPSKAAGFRIAMITASDGKELTYLPLNKYAVETSRFDVGGIHENISGIMGYMYGDRNIYRPGEQLNISAIIRDAAWNPLVNLPAKMRILLPNGHEYRSLRFTTNDQGSFATSITIPQGAVTGTYTAELYSANDILLYSQYISVEEFMPDRISVMLKPDIQQVKPGDIFTIALSAYNLFGPPAAGRNYQMEFALNRRSFQPAQYKGYNFNLITQNDASIQKELREGKTDAAGTATQQFKVPDIYQNMGLLTSRIYSTVFDESGRPVNRLAMIDVYTQQAFLGLQCADAYTAAGAAFSARAIATDKNGKSIAQEAILQLVRLQWETVLQKNEYENYNYVSQKREQIISEKKINIPAGGTDLQFVPQSSGQYQIRLLLPGAKSYVMNEFYAWGYGFTSSTSFAVNREGRIDIEMDKKGYAIGDKADILFKTPFPGKILVSVERNKVHEYYVLNTDKKSAVLTLPIKEEFLPNIYISAIAFKPVDDGAMPLTIATGYAPVMVEKTQNKMLVSITAPDKIRSNTKQNIRIRAGNEQNIPVTIAVVDEGILQLKEFKSPDPYAHFYGKRALAVQSFSVYPKLFPEFNRKFSFSSSGGDGYDLNKRVNPFTNKRTQLLSYWSGILRTNAQGEASVDIPIPQFSGSARIMAIAYKNKAFGWAEKKMIISDPLVISNGLPRFLSPGDTVEMPLTIANTTTKSGAVQAEISLNGGLTAIGQSKQTIAIAGNSEQTVYFRIAASSIPGIARIGCSVQGLGEKNSSTTEISIRPVNGLISQYGSGKAEAGKTASFAVGKAGIDQNNSGMLIISPSPLVQYAASMEQLLAYPHGCLEQTISTAFPQIYFEDLVRALRRTNSSLQQDKKSEIQIPGTPAYNVQQAINKIASQQIYNGALSYWPGEQNETWWGTAYAAHFLHEAKQNGFEVPKVLMDKIIQYLQERLQNVRNNKLQSNKQINSEVAYSTFVLALENRPDNSMMNYLKSNPGLLNSESKFMLYAALLYSGDNRKANGLLQNGASVSDRSRELSGSFYSPLREQALSLEVLLETDPENSSIPDLARALSRQIMQSGRLNTQELSFTLMALGKFARKRVMNAETHAQIQINGKKVNELHNNDITLRDISPGSQVQIQNTGKGEIYYFWSAKSIGAEQKNTDAGIMIKRQYLLRNGSPLQGNMIKQNDLLIIKLTVQPLLQRYLSNIVITDMLPAGLEIENPRISALPELGWIKDNTPMEHIDIRDDRIHFFGSVGEKGITLYYVARAVSTGSFRLGTASADAMYDPSIFSYKGGGNLLILRR
jgi:uncharacterized protein YfaS (alpha-2-macroglobulin family)